MTIMRGFRSVAAAVFLLIFSLSAHAWAGNGAARLAADQDEKGSGVPLDSSLLAPEAAASAVAAPEAAAPGGTKAATEGVFGTVLWWPIIAIHTVLLPDGRVLNYGTDERGAQGAQFVYDVWNPNLGTGQASHLVLDNKTGTDIFCGAQSVLAGSGEVLLSGGDDTINGIRNYSNKLTTIFMPNQNALDGTEQPMAFKRWYPSIIPLPTGEKLVLGGRENRGDPATTPEVYSEVTGWRSLTSATSNAAFGITPGFEHYYYPRAYKLPNDPSKVLVLGLDGKLFYVDPTGLGSITQLSKTTLPGSYKLPTLMFAPGKVFSVRSNKKVIIADLNGPQPAITTTADISQTRFWSNATVLADGKVLVTGGSAVDNQLTAVAKRAEIWNPATGKWTLGASADRPRLYHSTALLLPDGTVLTAGGGATGPVQNLNAEIYYPPYLYNADGTPAARPTLASAPASLALSAPTRQFAATVGSGNKITRVALLRSGSTTHANNLEQRYQQLAFTQSGQTLTITSPTNPNYTITGYYLLFVFNDKGVPSSGKIIKILK